MADSHSKTTVRIAGCIMRKKCGIRTLTDPMRLLCSFDWDNFLHPISLFTLNTLSPFGQHWELCPHLFLFYFILSFSEMITQLTKSTKTNENLFTSLIYIYIYFHSHFMRGEIKSMRLELLSSYTIHKN